MSYGMHLVCSSHGESVWLTVHGGAGARLAPGGECAIACFVDAHEECPVELVSEDVVDEITEEWSKENLAEMCERYAVAPSAHARMRDRMNNRDVEKAIARKDSP